MIEEHVTFENGRRIVVPRETDPRDTARGDVRVELLDAREYLAGYTAGVDRPPPHVYETADGAMAIQVSNLNAPQAFYHRSMTHAELHIPIIGKRTVETENGTVTQEPGQFIYIPRGLAHRNIGHGPENLFVVVYVNQEFIRQPLGNIGGR
jgi:homogentisate 1,2-dioxygenase